MVESNYKKSINNRLRLSEVGYCLYLFDFWNTVLKISAIFFLSCTEEALLNLGIYKFYWMVLVILSIPLSDKSGKILLLGTS